MRGHTKLRAFELADDVAMLVYQATKGFSKEEMYGITSQMRRAAVSIPSNIVEGCARQSHAEYLRFLEIAFASLRELDYQRSLSKRLGYFGTGNAALESKIQETGMVLSALIRSLRKPNSLTV